MVMFGTERAEHVIVEYKELSAVVWSASLILGNKA